MKVNNFFKHKICIAFIVRIVSVAACFHIKRRLFVCRVMVRETYLLIRWYGTYCVNSVILFRGSFVSDVCVCVCLVSGDPFCSMWLAVS